MRQKDVYLKEPMIIIDAAETELHDVQEAKKAGTDYHTLPPLFKLVIAKPMPGYEKNYLETKYECPKCKATSTLETFLEFYTEK